MQSIKITAFVLLLVSLTMTSCSNDNDETINGETPSEISAFMNEYYPSQDFVVSEDLDDGVLTYEVDVENGVELEFDENGTLTSIDGNDQAINTDLIPQELVVYVNTNYPDNYITSWDLDILSQEVDLDNDYELTFDLNNQFISVDKD